MQAEAAGINIGGADAHRLVVHDHHLGMQKTLIAVKMYIFVFIRSRGERKRSIYTRYLSYSPGIMI